MQKNERFKRKPLKVFGIQFVRVPKDCDVYVAPKDGYHLTRNRKKKAE